MECVGEVCVMTKDIESKPLTELQVEILAVMLDMEAIAPKSVKQEDVINEALRRLANKKAGMLT